MSQDKEMIKIDDLDAYYGDFRALKDINIGSPRTK